MSIWGFLGGAADAGSRMLEDSRKQQLEDMKQEALFKRQMALKALEEEKTLERQKELAKYNNDLNENNLKIMQRADGSVIGITKDGKTQDIVTGDPDFYKNKKEKQDLEMSMKQTQLSAAEARLGQSAAINESRKASAEIAQERLELARKAQGDSQENRRSAQFMGAVEMASKAWAAQNPFAQAPPDKETIYAMADDLLSRAGGKAPPTQAPPVPTAESMMPGSSAAMPLPVKPGDPRPPSGTYVIDTVTGKMGRVP